MLRVTLILTLGVLSPPAAGFSVDNMVGLVQPNVAVASVEACGFKNVRSKFDTALQDDVIEVSNVTSASGEQLECAARASLQSSYHVTFPAPLQQAYQESYWHLFEARARADARAWLAKRGLLSRVPVYDPETSDEAEFARALEGLCGPRAAGTLEPVGGAATFREGALNTFENGKHSAGTLDEETLWCLANAASVAGYAVVFIGHEARTKDR